MFDFQVFLFLVMIVWWHTATTKEADSITILQYNYIFLICKHEYYFKFKRTSVTGLYKLLTMAKLQHDFHKLPYKLLHVWAVCKNLHKKNYFQNLFCWWKFVQKKILFQNTKVPIALVALTLFWSQFCQLLLS